MSFFNKKLLDGYKKFVKLKGLKSEFEKFMVDKAANKVKEA